MERCEACGRSMNVPCVDCGTTKKNGQAVRCWSCYVASRRRAPKFDVSPLVRGLSLSEAAARVGMDRSQLRRSLLGGVSERVADRLCSRVGWHLSQLPTFNKVEA